MKYKTCRLCGKSYKVENIFVIPVFTLSRFVCSDHYDKRMKKVCATWTDEQYQKHKEENRLSNILEKKKENGNN